MKRRTSILAIRLTPEERRRVERAARRARLDVSTWARSLIVSALPELVPTSPGVTTKETRKNG